MFEQTITIFNEYKSKGKSYFLSTVLQGVELQQTQGRNISKTGIASADKALLIINKDSLAKTFLEPRKWQELSREQAIGYFTLTPMKNDFFIEGKYTEIVEDFETFSKGKDNLFKVSTVDDYVNVLPHFEVGGV